MFKRISASLFILLLAGQVWAGVCGCVNDVKSGMSCCKRTKTERAIRGKSCCGDSCIQNTQTATPRSQSSQDSSINKAEPSVLAPFSAPSVRLRRHQALSVSTAVGGTSPSMLARPPNLFIANHTFRI